MKCRKLTPNIIVEDVAKTQKWYEDVLGFETFATVPGETGLVFAMMQQGDVMLMFQAKDIESTPSFRDAVIGGTISLYIEVDSVDSFYTRCKEMNCTLLNEINETFYGTREFTMYDLNGYILIFAEDIKKEE